MKLGYSWVAMQPGIKVPEPEYQAEVRSVSRIEQQGKYLAIPPGIRY